jgi:hypothetical protein
MSTCKSGTSSLQNLFYQLYLLLSEGPSNDKKNVMTDKLLNRANGSLKLDGATNEENSSDKRFFQILFSYILTISKFLGLL